MAHQELDLPVFGEEMTVIGEEPPPALANQERFTEFLSSDRSERTGGGIPFLDKIIDFFKKSGKGGSVGFPGMEQLIGTAASAIFGKLFGGASDQEKQLIMQAIRAGEFELDNLINSAELRDELKQSIRGPRLGSELIRRTGGEGFRFSSKIGEPSNSKLFLNNIDFGRLAKEEQFPELLRTLMSGGSQRIGQNSLFGQNLGAERREAIGGFGGAVTQAFLDNPEFLSGLFARKQGSLDSFIDPTNDPGGELT